MKFICDVHIPIRLSKFLAAQGADSVHINQILDGAFTPDDLISQHADANDCIVITKDIDFRNSYFIRKMPRKLIRICLGNLSNDSLIQLFEKHLTLIDRLDQEGSFYMEINPDTVLLF